MTAVACHPAAEPRPGRRRRGGSMASTCYCTVTQASTRHPAARPRQGRRRRRRRCAMMASARHPAARRSRPPVLRRWGCAMTASAAQCPGSRSQKGRARLSESKSGEQGGQLIVGGRDETLEGGNSGWRGHRGGRDDQATAKLCQALGHQRDHAVSKGRGRGSMIICRRDQRRLEPLEGFDGLERLQVDERKRKRGKQLEMLMHVVSSASGARRQCKESRLCQETLRYHNR